MTTPTVVSVTDELIAELEQKAHEATFSCCGNYGVGGEYMGSQEQICCGNPDADPSDIPVDSDTILALLAERKELKRDAERWRFYAPNVAKIVGVTLDEMNAVVDESLQS